MTKISSVSTPDRAVVVVLVLMKISSANSTVIVGQPVPENSQVVPVIPKAPTVSLIPAFVSK